MDSKFNHFRILQEHASDPPPEIFLMVRNRLFDPTVEDKGCLARLQDHAVLPPDFISPRIANRVSPPRPIKRPLAKSLMLILKKILALPMPR